MVEDAATAVNLSLSLSIDLSRPSSPGALCSQQRLGGGESKCRQGKGGGARLFTYLCRGKTKPLGDKIGEVSLRSGAYNPDPISPPTCPPSPHLIAQTVMSHPLTPRRAAMAAPEKTTSKDAPGVVSRWKGNTPQPIPSELRNRAPSPLRSRGSKAGPFMVSTAASGRQSQGQLWASLYMAEAQASDCLGCPKSCPRPAGVL